LLSGIIVRVILFCVCIVIVDLQSVIMLNVIKLSVSRTSG
jgi:hypothetical protein